MPETLPFFFLSSYHNVSFQKLSRLQGDAHTVSVAWTNVTETKTSVKESLSLEEVTWFYRNQLNTTTTKKNKNKTETWCISTIKSNHSCMLLTRFLMNTPLASPGKPWCMDDKLKKKKKKKLLLIAVTSVSSRWPAVTWEWRFSWGASQIVLLTAPVW